MAEQQLTRRQQKRIERTQQILDTAMELLVEQGVDGLTIHTLAKRMEWAVGSMYRYFDSKDALRAALVISVIDDFGEDIRNDLSQGHVFLQGRSDGVARLFDLLVIAKAYEKRYLKEPAQTHLLNLMLVEPRTVLPAKEGELVTTATVRMLQTMSDYFRIAQDAGDLSPGPLVERTLQYWLALHGAMLPGRLGRFYPRLFQLDLLVRQMSCSLLLSWGAGTDAVEQASQLLDEMTTRTDGS